MLPRTPLLAVYIAGILSLLVIYFFELPFRPFSSSQVILLFFVSLFPAMGIAMLFDPAPAKFKEEYLKINFYEKKDGEKS